MNYLDYFLFRNKKKYEFAVVYIFRSDLWEL